MVQYVSGEIEESASLQGVKMVYAYTMKTYVLFPTLKSIDK